MICIASEIIHAKAARMPLGYLEDCRSAATVRAEGKYWCFQPSDFSRIRRKYRGYAVSQADTFRDGEIISGCCDRADQY
jgi:hypothetical protein